MSMSGARWWLSWALLPAVLGIAACRGDKGAADSGQDSATQPIPHRIVCGAPSVAEIVFALGMGERVVGVSDYTVYPPEARTKKSIGGWINPSRERLLMVKPDIIITQGQHETLAAFAAEYGIRFLAVKLDTLKDIYSATEAIAEALGVVERGATLSAELQHTIQAVEMRVAEMPPKPVLLLFGRAHGGFSGLATVGPGTFLDDLLHVAGGKNIFADAKGAYPQVSKEALLVRRPEVILEINPGETEEKTVARLRADWQEFADLPAVHHDRIHYLTNDFLLIPGLRVGLIAEAFADAVHPETAQDPDP